MPRPISKIYERYDIPFWLAEHMYRVAAVAAALFDASLEKHPELEGRHGLVMACLLHDIGNIIKFDFDLMPPPDGKIDHWKAVQADFKKRFGSDELLATDRIMEELGVLSEAEPILRHTSFPDSEELLSSGTVLQKIAGYADQRVAPSGIVSLAERLDYMHRRYAERGSVYGATEDSKVQKLTDAISAIEAELFAGLSVRPEDLTDATLAPLVASLRSFEI